MKKHKLTPEINETTKRNYLNELNLKIARKLLIYLDSGRKKQQFEYIKKMQKHYEFIKQ